MGIEFYGPIDSTDHRLLLSSYATNLLEFLDFSRAQDDKINFRFHSGTTAASPPDRLSTSFDDFPQILFIYSFNMLNW